MPQYVTAIRTSDGDKLIDFNALANRNHAEYHRSDGVDPITPEMIGAQPASSAVNKDNIANQTVKSAKSADSAKTATKLTNKRTIQTKLSSTVAAEFDGTANITPGVIGTLGIANGGTGATTASDALKKLGLTATAAELNAMKEKADLVPISQHGAVGVAFAPSKQGGGFYATWNGTDQITISKTSGGKKLEATVTMGDKTQNILYETNHDSIQVRDLVGFRTGFYVSIYSREDEIEYVGDHKIVGLIYSWESGLVHKFNGRGHTSQDDPNIKVVAIRPQGVILSGIEEDDYYWCYYGTTAYKEWTLGEVPQFNCIYTPDANTPSAPAVCDGKSITWYSYKLEPTVVNDPYGLGSISKGLVVANNFSNVFSIDVNNREINGIPYTWINGKWVFGHHTGIAIENGFIQSCGHNKSVSGVQLL